MEYDVHETPGRLRLKIPGLKRNSLITADMQRLFKFLPGIKSTSINTVTGSIIAHYDPELIQPEAIINFLAREGHIDSAKPISRPKGANKTLEVVTRAASKAVLGFFLDRALQGTPLAIVTAFF